MGRLTVRKIDRYGNKYIATGGGVYFEEESVYKALEKLAHYEDLEEQGRLIEQKHGQWELHHVGVGHYWKCSVCHTNPCIYVTKDTNYCPNCGAKMDLKDLKGE